MEPLLLHGYPLVAAQLVLSGYLKSSGITNFNGIINKARRLDLRIQFSRNFSRQYLMSIEMFDDR